MLELKRKHGKHLDKKVKLRLKLYFAISIVLIAVVSFEVLTNRVSLLFAVIGLMTGDLIGIIVARMFLLSWDKNAEKVISRLDIIGGVILVVYVLFSLFRGRIISQYVQANYVTGTSLSVVTGIMIGRVLGTGQKIVKILNEQGLIA